MIDTPRLTLVPLTLDQLRLHIADDHQLEQTLGLRRGHREVTEPLLSIITHFVIPRLQDSTLNPLYQTIWIAIDQQKEQIVADAKFKGEPDETGTVEIGYGTYTAFQRQGYMAEMVGGLLKWAGQQPGIRRVVADTDAGNVGSQRVLEKTGFRLFEQLEDMLWWEYIFEEATTETLQFDEYGYLRPYEINSVSLKIIKDQFVTNPHRATLFQQLLNFITAIEENGVPVIRVDIYGSFIAKKVLPNDIDVVVYLPYSYTHSRLQWLTDLSLPYGSLDVRWVPLFNQDDPKRQAIDKLEEMKWFVLFSADRGGRPKGFVSINDLPLWK